MDLKIKDVRAEMPNYANYKDWQRSGPILGIAVHHSATADRTTGAPIGNADTFFDYHVNQRGWAHGGYNYVITGSGDIEYAWMKNCRLSRRFCRPGQFRGFGAGPVLEQPLPGSLSGRLFSQGRTYRDDAGRTQPFQQFQQP